MDKWIAENPSTKRWVTGLGAMLAAGMSTKLGISNEVALGILGLAATMITGSNWREAKEIGAEAASKVSSTTDAVAVFKQTGPVP